LRHVHRERAAAPGFNGIEHQWKTLKAHLLVHETFKNAAGLKTATGEENKATNHNRKLRSLAKPRISA
jgi:hypothetical protein